MHIGLKNFVAAGGGIMARLFGVRFGILSNLGCSTRKLRREPAAAQPRAATAGGSRTGRDCVSPRRASRTRLVGTSGLARSLIRDSGAR